jgi:hypothetical protein
MAASFAGTTSDSSPNLGLQSEGFRNYADYMLTAEFQQAIQNLLKLARKWTAIMCAERFSGAVIGGWSATF